jgi:hypothetical protein
VVDLARCFDDQYVVLEAVPGTDAGSRPHSLEEPTAELVEEVAKFHRDFARTTDRWRTLLAENVAERRRTAIWGAGSKGVSFLTTLNAGTEIAYAVDINPYKHGKYLAGTGHAVVGPAHLAIQPPDVVIAMNPIYLEEIQAELDLLGLQGTKLLGV